MPKKFKGENSKAVEAKARKNAAKTEKEEEEKRRKEDEEWRDDDKNALRKQGRKEDRDRKKVDVAERKAQNRLLAEVEMNSIEEPTSTAPKKITQAELAAAKTKQALEAEQAQRILQLQAKKVVVEGDEVPIEENVNRLVIGGEVARNVEEAISVLNDSPSEIDKHPEKRMKAAFLTFEENRMPVLKREHPTLRLSQIKQILKKEWMKSPQNPLNAALLQ